ncbi:uncharacterized protein BJX67DRAFT_380661 [Aspergillus lucknowensis]|uniref:Ankyrin n=1 Tax=Aspergillus lucknowensis TaxID=176173 RepID=A0ABR4LWF7_9EURO
MAEPVSSAASAAGLIALGIESTKLIVKYCDGLRGRDNDVDNLRIKAGGLLSTLQLIASLLNQNNAIHPHIAADINSNILANENGIREINDRVAKLSPPTGNMDISDKMRATGKKVLYPFRREGLLDTVRILEGLQMNLHTALLAEGQGINICPMLQFHPVVPDDSPAFKLLREFNYWVEPREFAAETTQLIQGLQRLFDDGESSPYDRTVDGHTLLHYACYFAAEVRSVRGYKELHRFSDPSQVVFDYLVRAGCPVNEGARPGARLPFGLWDPISHISTVLGILIESKAESALIRHLLDHGAIFSDIHLLDHEVAVRFQDELAKHEDAFVLSPIFEIVLARSYVDDLKRLVDHEKGLSRNATAMKKLLSISLAWAEGLRTILEACPDVPYWVKANLLSQAVRSGEWDSARVLIELGAPILARHISQCTSDEIQTLLIDALVNRRRELLSLAVTSLPQHTHNKLGLRHGFLPDLNAAEIFDELEARGVAIDSSLEPFYESSMLEHGCLSTEVMDRLYQAGFRDIELLDGNSAALIPHACGCVLPRPIGNVLARSRWLVEKGGSQSITRGIGRTTTHHGLVLDVIFGFIYSDLNNPHRYPRQHDGSEALRALSQADRQHFREVCGSGCRDCCNCFCSPGGCSALSVALRLLLDTWFQKYINAINLAHHLFIVFLEFLVSQTEQMAGSAITVIRLLTFTDLAITHTCCRTQYLFGTMETKLFDAEDALEIQDEERFMIEKYESLVQELYEEYEASGLPLWDYIQTHWCRRVQRHRRLEVGETNQRALCFFLWQPFAEEVELVEPVELGDDFELHKILEKVKQYMS